MNNSRSVEVLIELEAILKANTDISYVESAKAIVPIASETNDTAVYISFTNSVPELNKNRTGMDGYDIHSFFILNINVDCTSDKYRVYDIVDSIQRSILNDSGIWTKLVDRDILTIEYDNAEFYPKRSAVIALEVIQRLACN